MAWVRCVAVIAIGVLVITSPARAGGLSLDKTGTAASGPIGLETTIPLAKSKDTDQSQTSIDSATSDLESSRAAINRRTGPAITLGVSGWVGEQVMSGSH